MPVGSPGDSSAIIERMLQQVLQDPESAQRYLQMCELASIGGMVSGITHTLNNIMGGILGYSQLMKQDLQQTPDLLRQAEIIEHATKRASTLISQVQFYTKGHGRVRRTVNPQALIDNVVAIVQSATREVKVLSSCHLSDAKITADAASVCHALLNICINAVEAMPNGGELSVSATTVKVVDAEEDRGNLMIEIADTGCGIPHENLALVCRPFFSTKPANRASGVGLSVALEIIENHDGRLEIFSQEDAGTTVSVYFPLVEPATTEAPTSVLPESTAGPSGEAIMVVDDEADLRLLAKRLLERRGHTVFLADSGPNAIEVFEQNADEIGVVILDMIMPGVDGKEVYRRMKEIRGELRFILTSGYPGAISFQKILDSPGDQFIPKPWDMPHLIQEAERLVGTGTAREAQRVADLTEGGD